jgi:hypothetical protein
VHPPEPGRPGVGWQWPQPRPRPIPGFWICPARCPGRSRACRGPDPGVDVIKVEQPGTGDDTRARGRCGATWPPTPVGRPEQDRRRTGRPGAAIVSWVTRRGAASTPTCSRRRPLLFEPGAALADRAATHRTAEPAHRGHRPQRTRRRRRRRRTHRPPGTSHGPRPPRRPEPLGASILFRRVDYFVALARERHFARCRLLRSPSAGSLPRFFRPRKSGTG